ncbi:MAG: ABC transporter permease [Clostridiales Family XIII bacterium]|nr:ABC transporter permease [Clostridiales Family XIII bacterium]
MSSFSIARNNLLHRPFRLCCLAALIAVTAFVIAGGTLFGLGLRNGVASTAARLGADAMFLPVGAERNLEGALLEGKPSTFYLPGDAVRALSELKGVKRTSPQLYISTFDSAHCGALVQIIGYDPETDFVVTPWLKENGSSEPGRGEIVIGSDINLALGEKMLLFGASCVVVGKLERTGMGFDATVFVGKETARMLIDEYETYIGAIPMPDENAASVVTAEIEDGLDHETFVKEVRKELDGVNVILPQAIIGNLARNLDLTIGVLMGIPALLWVLSAFVLVIVSTITLHERKREFGVLRALGATRKKLLEILLAESVLLGVLGAGAGVLLFCVTALPFNALLESKLASEYLLPSADVTVPVLIACFLLCAAGGPIAAFASAAGIGRAETSLIMREDV